MNEELHPKCERLSSFFGGLGSVVRIAEKAQKRLDLRAATSFSVFRYFSEHEHTFSTIFADLLNPKGCHGQQERFLKLFLDAISLDIAPIDPKTCQVQREYVTTDRRRIDILLEFPGSSPTLIGIENKPWAAEQPDQLRDYMQALQKLGKDVGLVYLSGDGSEPRTLDSEKEDLKGRYRTVPYRIPSANERASVETWLQDCWFECSAEQVRWFLTDCLNYIRSQFPE